MTLLISACATVARFDNNEPATLIAGKDSKLSIKVKNWHESDQLVLLPGGPYQKQGMALPLAAKLIGTTGNYVIVIDESNELRILDFSTTPIKQQASLELIDTASTLTVEKNQIYVGFEKEGIWQFDISRPDIIKKRAEFTNAPQVSRIQLVDEKLYALSDQRRIAIFYPIKTNDKPVKIAPHKTLRLPAIGHDFAVLDQQLVLLGPKIGLAIVEALHPDKIVAQHKLQGSQTQFAIRDNIAYIADGEGGLVLLDMSNRNSLQWLGSHNKFDSVDKVLVSNNQAFVIDRDVRLASLNTNNKELPITGSFYKPGGNIHDAAMGDDVIYLATSQGVEQVSFPNKPHAQISNEGINQGGTRRAFIEGNIAYVADWFSGLHLYDISNPQQPLHLSNYHTPGSSKGVVVEDGYAYVGDDDHGLQIIDIRDPRQPKKVSEVLTTGLAYTLKKVGNLIYLADHRGGFHIIDVQNVEQPKMITSHDTPGKSWAIDVVGHIAFVADDSSGLLIFDVSDTRHPVQIGQFNPGGYAEDVVVDNNLAYISFFDKGFYIVDVSNPAKPVEISHVAVPGNARSVVLKGIHAYVAGWESGLNIIDISDKHKPVIVGNYDTKGSAWGVDVYGQHAFVWDWWGGVKVIDVSNPASPTLAGKYHARGNIVNLRQKGNYIYTANGQGGVQVFDIKNILNPIWATGIDVNGITRDVWPSRSTDYVYAISNQSGLLVFDVSNPFYIRAIGQYPTGGQPKRVLQHQQTVFVANEKSGLASFNTSNPHALQKIQDLAIDVKSMWADQQVLFIASKQQGLIAFDIDDKGRLKRRIKAIDQIADHVVTRDKLLVSATDHSDITVWRVKNNVYSAVARLTLDHAILDLHIEQRKLMVATRNGGLMVYDISTPSNPRLETRYPATDHYGKFIVHQDGVFFGGTHTIASIQLLPAISWQRLDENSIELNVPATLPIGNYHLAIKRLQGSEQLWPNALNVSLPKRRKPKMTQEQFQELLKKHRSRQP